MKKIKILFTLLVISILLIASNTNIKAFNSEIGPVQTGNEGNYNGYDYMPFKKTSNKENNNAALYIYSQSYGSSMGKIKSKIDNNSDYFGAAIGSSMKKDQGRIEIHGGHIYAEAREKASELGESGGGAGIGSGRDASGASVIIHGGNIEAYGGDYAAGIGSGCEYLFNDGRNGGQLNIQGGHVEAYGGIDGAGIGGGEADDGGDVTITGGTVIAKSGILGKTGMRGIGPGYDCTIPMRPRPSTPSAPSSRFSKGCQVKTEAM